MDKTQFSQRLRNLYDVKRGVIDRKTGQPMKLGPSPWTDEQDLIDKIGRGLIEGGADINYLTDPEIIYMLRRSRIGAEQARVGHVPEIPRIKEGILQGILRAVGFLSDRKKAIEQEDPELYR